MARSPGLAALLTRTADAHHQAYAATDGFDPNWPVWYARYLRENGFELLVHKAVSESDLAEWLKDTDRRHKAEAPETPWVPYYVSAIFARAAGRTE